MKKIIALTLIVFAAGAGISWNTVFVDKISYKCLIQLTNYGGEGAYVITSLIKPGGVYEKTLFVGGDDEEWYPDLPTWYEFHKSVNADIDGITGASIQSGARKVALLEIDADKVNSGYKLRFESSVEDGRYHDKDLELELSDAMVGKTIKGSGYIRYVRIIKK